MQIKISNLPNETKEIFDTLRGGNFITDNHPEQKQRRMFHICEENTEVLRAYFRPLGYDLEKGDGYFMFYTEDMPETAKEHRIDQILQLLDIVELLYGVFPHFDIGWKGSPSDLEMALKSDTIRRERLERMRGARGITMLQKCTSMFEQLNKFGCFVPLNDKYGNFLVTSAFNYVVEFFESVQRINSNIKSEEEGEDESTL